MTDPSEPPQHRIEDDDLWERHADWWIDGFTEGADAEYEEQILPLAAEELAGAHRILDVGCGDGQVSRLAAASGAELVIGIDPTWNQVRVARARGGGPAYASSGAARLPFPARCFEAVVACLVFEHIDDVDDALGEVARVLDVGTGDGQVARRAAGLGAAVVGIDPTWNQIRVAHRRGGGPVYLSSGAAALPFPDATFDTVVACLVFEHIEAVDEAIGEVARVLEPGGRFLFFLNHPLLQTPDSGWIDDQVLDPPEQYWRIGAYLREDASIEEVEKNVFIPFIHRPLHRYVNALSSNGLLVTHMEEPAPPAGFLARAPEYTDAAEIPRLLFLRTEKLR